VHHDERDDRDERDDPRDHDPARRHIELLVSHGSRFIETLCICQVRLSRSLGARYALRVPKLWNDTIEAHRHEVRQAILETTAALAIKHGLTAVTMSQIADETGIGRATLYKYFSDVEAILVAWHEHQVTTHLAQLKEVRDRAGDPAERLEAVLEAFALISHERHPAELVALLHRGEHVAHAHEQLLHFIRDLVAEGAKAGQFRDDVAPHELASYCMHALLAASSLPSKAAVRRLVKVALAGLRA
jgi:AcrR family transcriptional regulator